MILSHQPIEIRVPASPTLHRCRGAALTQVLLVCLIVLVGSASALLILRSGGSQAPAGEAREEKTEAQARDKNQDEHAGQGGHAARGHVAMTPAKLANARLTIEPVQAATIRLNLRVFGKVTPDEEKLAHVSPRYAGIARKVAKRLGDTITAGEMLVAVESNESLQTYEVKAPLAGTIIERNVTVGEFVSTDKSLFTVADLDTVWVDFQIYQQDFARLRVGQPVRVSTNSRVATSPLPEIPPSLAEEDGSATITGSRSDDYGPVPKEANRDEVRSTVAYLSPFGAESTQTMLARAYVPNRGGALRPGLFVTGEIAVDEINAPIAVREDAVQTLDGQEVVFVEADGGFEARTVQVGQRDGDHAQVLSGLKAGERYVAANSFILKAEIGKEGAEED